MARFQFGGNGDIALHAADGVTLVSPLGTTVGTAWDSRTGGTQYTDLQNLDGSAISGGNLTATDGAEPQWLGPDGIQQMWVGWGSGRRYLRTTNSPAGGGSGNGFGNIYRVIATGSPLTYVISGLPTRSQAPARDYMGTLDPTSGSFGFDATVDTWNGRPYSFATSSFTAADRAFLDLFDRTTPTDESQFVYDTASPTKPWVLKPYAPAPTYVTPSIILNAGDPVPSGFAAGVVYDRPAAATTTPTLLGESMSNGTTAGTGGAAVTTTASLSVGDWIIASVGCTGGATSPTLGLTTPAGFTVQKVATFGNASQSVAVFVAQVTSAQASGIALTPTSDITPSAGVEVFCKIVKLSGLSGTPATVLDQSATGGAGNSATLTLTASAATSQANEISVAVLQFSQGNPVTSTRTAVTSGWTEVGTALPSTDTAPRAFAMFYKVRSAIGTETITYTLSAATGVGGALVTLKSA